MTHLFSASVTLSKPLPAIPVPGGERIGEYQKHPIAAHQADFSCCVVSAIAGGNISGSALNASVAGGVAYPILYENGTIEDAEIILYGSTLEDEVPYFAQLSGIGSSMSQNTRTVSSYFFGRLGLKVLTPCARRRSTLAERISVWRTISFWLPLVQVRIIRR